MAKSRTFPVEFKVSGRIIRILRDPVTVSAKSKRSMAKGKGTSKQYDSFVVEYYVGGERKRIRRNSYELALAEVDRLKIQVLNNDEEAMKLIGDDRRKYVSAVEDLKSLKNDADKTEIPLDDAIKEYVDAVKKLRKFNFLLSDAISQFVDALARLKGRSMSEVIAFFERFGGNVVGPKTVADIIPELLASMEADKVGDYHRRDTKRRLGRFSSKFTGLITDITETEIEEWLRGLQALPGRRKLQEEKPRELEPKTRNHYRNAVNSLFNFAKQKHYLPRDLPTAAEGTKLVKVIRGENAIFKPDEMEMLLSKAPGHLVPGMAVKAFSGVRTEEIVEIDWSDILFDQDAIVIPAKISKLGQRRLIHLHPNLKAWLTPYRKDSGRLCERWTKPQSVFQAWDRFAKNEALDVHIGENKFRNSFISYRVAETNNIPLVAKESGNSPEIIEREYLEITTPQEASKWFSIMPKKT